MTKVPILELSDVERAYPGQPPVRALDGVRLTIHEGDFVSITGPSGAGKSSLLNVLGLLDRKDRGTYLIRGISIDSLSSRKLDALRGQTFGFVFQSAHIISGRSVAKNVELPLVIRRETESIRPELVRNALDRAGIAHKANSEANLLSGGERQRLAIARALVHEPDVLLLDEPTGNLDSRNSAQISNLLQTLHDAGVTIVLVTHDHSLAETAERQIVLVDGRVTEKDQQQRSLDVPARRPLPTERLRRPLTSALDAVSDALYSLTAKPLRALLLIAVIVLGSGGLVAAQGVSATAASQISGLLSKASLDQVYASSVAANGADAGIPFTDADVTRARSLDGVTGGGLETNVGSTGFTLTRLRDTNGLAPAFDGLLLGADAGVLEADRARLDHPASLALLNQGALQDNIAYVGRNAAKALGISQAEPGVNVWINGQAFAVVSLISSAPGDKNLVNSVVVSNTALSARLRLTVPMTLFLKTESGGSHSVGSALPLQLNPVNPQLISVQSLADLGKVRAGVNTQLNGLILVMALVLLVLAVLATAAVMASSVLSRRGEVGLRRAIGSSRQSVAGLFVLEGLIMGTAGGLVGASIGIVVTLLASHVQGWTPVISVTTPLVGIAVGIVVGAVSTIIPAYQASRIQPALAIRG